MKQILCSFLTLSMLVVMPVFANSNEAHIPTTDYVDSGLRAVYQRARDADAQLRSDINEINSYIGTPTESGGQTLTQQIAAISSDIETIENGMEYSDDEHGVDVSNETKKIGISGLDDNTKIDNKVYVFKNNTATELEMVGTWDPSPGGE